MGIEGVLPTEDLDAKNVLFEVAPSTCQGLRDRETQELQMSRRVAEIFARKNLVQYEMYRFDGNLGSLAC
jgi:hypothetical protein